MERRAHPRQRLQLNVTVTGKGLKPQAAAMRDFCPGGVLLVAEMGSGELIGSRKGGLARGDAVGIHFSAPTPRGDRMFHLRGRVARVFEGGVGIAFSAVEPGVLQVLQALADQARQADAARGAERARTLAEHAAKRPAAQIREADRIIASCKACVTEQLPAILNTFFSDAHKRLLAGAKDSPSNVEQTRHFDAIGELKNKHGPMERRFSRFILEGLDDFGGRRVAPSDAPQEDSTTPLSLVDTEDFEDWLAVGEVAYKGETALREDIVDLQQRFSSLLGREIDAENDPLGPAAFTHAFHEALKDLAIHYRVRQTLYGVFGELLVPHLRTLYRDLKAVLAKGGVAAAPLRPVVTPSTAPAPREKPEAPAPQTQPAESGTPSPVASAAATAAPTMGAPMTGAPTASVPPTGVPAAGAPGPLVQSGPFPGTPGGAAQTVAGGMAASGAAGDGGVANYGGFFDGGEAAAHGLYHTVRELLNLRNVAGFASETTGEAPSPPGSAGGASTIEGAAARYETNDILQALSAVQSERGGKPAAGWQGIKLKAQVLRKLLARQARGEPRRQIGPEEGDAIDVIDTLFNAMLDDAIVADGIKPWIKKLEIPLVKAALLDDALFKDQSHPSRQVLNQFDRLGMAFAGEGEAVDPGLRRTADQLLERIVGELDRDAGFSSDLIEEVETLGDIQARAHARNLERVVLEAEGKHKRRMAKRSVSKAIDERLAGKKVPKVLLAMLEAGWRALLVLTYINEGPDSQSWRDYLAIIDQILALLAPAEDSGEPPDVDVLGLVATIDNGLGYIGAEAFPRKKVVGQLRALLTQSAEARADSPPEMVDYQGGDEAESGAAPAGGSVEARSRLRELQVGDWLSMAVGSKPAQPVKLAWAADDGSDFVFVNRQGLRVAELTGEQLVDELDGGKTAALDEWDAPLLDRTMHRMLKQLYERLQHQATHDQLTGLANRKSFETRLEQVLQAAPRDNIQHVVCHMDLDQFKVINNTAGHEAGDKLLQQVAQLVQDRLRDRKAMIARLGDDEFGILLENCSQEEGRKIANELRGAVQDMRFVWESRQYAPTVSIGMVAATQASDTPASLLKAADAARIAAKDAGRNRVQLYQPGDVTLVWRHGVMEWVARIDRALDENRLQLRGQRISPIAVKTTHKPHMEILLSVPDDDGKLMPPAEFIQAAEMYSRMAAVDRWIIGKVFQWMADNPGTLDSLDAVAINLSGQSLNDETLCAFVFEQFSRTKVATRKICFEVTETVAVANLALAADFIREIEKIGCHFSLDDFGSGLSSYSYLKNLPVDFLKIDGMFVKDIVYNSADRAMVKSINEIAHFMGKKTIAEHVENAAALSLLREMGLDYAQGFWIEQPRLLEEMR